MKIFPVLMFAILAAAGGVSQAGGMPSSPGAEVYFVSPKDGDVVAPTFTVVFGLKGMGVAPAGVDRPATGHHHLLIDADQPPLAGQPMGGDVRHFGGGQTQADVTLEPGVHTLQLVLGDMNHVPHDPPVMSEVITVTVRAPSGAPRAPGGLTAQ